MKNIIGIYLINYGLMDDEFTRISESTLKIIKWINLISPPPPPPRLTWLMLPVLYNTL